MQIELRKIIPRPLKDRLAARPSGIWNCDLVFKQGAYIKIKAPSGSGKTTFIHSIYKLRQDYDGEVLVDNQVLTTLDSYRIAMMRQQAVSIVFQDLRLFPNLTARENIELKRVLYATTYYEVHVIDEMAERLGVTHILNQRAGICSYGEQQRIAIIRSLVQPFSWLIMDEPFSHLDNSNTLKAAALINEECRKRNAGLVITDLEDDTYFPYTEQYQL